MKGNTRSYSDLLVERICDYTVNEIRRDTYFSTETIPAIELRGASTYLRNIIAKKLAKQTNIYAQERPTPEAYIIDINFFVLQYLERQRQAGKKKRTSTSFTPKGEAFPFNPITIYRSPKSLNSMNDRLYRIVGFSSQNWILEVIPLRILKKKIVEGKQISLLSKQHRNDQAVNLEAILENDPTSQYQNL